MNDVIYNLLLTSELGFSLAGILRYRTVAANATDDPALPDDDGQGAEALLQAQFIELIETPLQGSLVAPQLSASAPVPLIGTLYSTAAGPLSVVLFNTGSPPVALHLSFLLPGTVAGGLTARPAPNAPASTLYSLLGRHVGIA